MQLKLILISLAISHAAALYGANSSVIQLTAGNFKEIVVNSPQPILVEFYAPWCGHCKQLAPIYKKLADSLKGIVRVASIDLDKYKGVGQPYGIKGFPTIKLFLGKFTLGDNFIIGKFI